MLIIFFLQGAIVFSNIVTTVSPTYAQEVRTAEVGIFPYLSWPFGMIMSDYDGSRSIMSTGNSCLLCGPKENKKKKKNPYGSHS